MDTHIILNRFRDQPDDIGIPRAGYVHHWHLWQDGEPIDAQIAEPDPWGKGHYPVNFDGLVERAEPHIIEYACHKVPLVLEMEVGQRVFDYRHQRDRLALEHIGKVVGALGGVDCVYGNGWGFNLHLGDEMTLESDLAAYSLIGCPDRLAITAYGKWDHPWALNLAPKIDRAKRLCDAIHWKTVNPVLFISPYVHPTGDVSLDDWRRTCEATRNVCEQMDCDAMIWWDGGRNRRPYEEARPYVEAAKEVLCE